MRTMINLKIIKADNDIFCAVLLGAGDRHPRISKILKKTLKTLCIIKLLDLQKKCSFWSDESRVVCTASTAVAILVSLNSCRFW